MDFIKFIHKIATRLKIEFAKFYTLTTYALYTLTVTKYAGL